MLNPESWYTHPVSVAPGLILVHGENIGRIGVGVAPFSVGGVGITEILARLLGVPFSGSPLFFVRGGGFGGLEPLGL